MVITSELRNDTGQTWAGSNALRDLNNVDTECTWKNAGSVAITKGTNLFWQVDLGASYDVTRVRLRGFNLDGYSTDVQATVCKEDGAKDCSDCGALLTPPVNGWAESFCLVSGRYVRLLLSDSNGKNWHFCRVEIYGYEKGKNNKVS